VPGYLLDRTRFSPSIAVNRTLRTSPSLRRIESRARRRNLPERSEYVTSNKPHLPLYPILLSLLDLPHPMSSPGPQVVSKPASDKVSRLGQFPKLGSNQLQNDSGTSRQLSRPKCLRGDLRNGCMTSPKSPLLSRKSTSSKSRMAKQYALRRFSNISRTM